MEFAGGGPGHQVDPRVLGVDSLLARPVGVHPDVLVEVLVARLVGEVALDEPLEVGPLLALALRKGAVLGKKSVERGHWGKVFTGGLLDMGEWRDGERMSGIRRGNAGRGFER